MQSGDASPRSTPCGLWGTPPPRDSAFLSAPVVRRVHRPRTPGQAVRRLSTMPSCISEKLGSIPVASRLCMPMAHVCIQRASHPYPNGSVNLGTNTPWREYRRKLLIQLQMVLRWDVRLYWFRQVLRPFELLFSKRVLRYATVLLVGTILTSRAAPHRLSGSWAGRRNRAFRTSIAGVRAVARVAGRLVGRRRGRRRDESCFQPAMSPCVLS